MVAAPLLALQLLASHYELLYTACELDGLPRQQQHHRRLQDPQIKYWLASSAFDEKGSPLQRRNITQPQNGMGYLSINPTDGQTMLFATERKQPQGWSNVDTYVVPLNGSVPPKPLFTLSNFSPLLAPCANLSVPCIQVSTFHATWTPDGSKVIFSYRPWSSLGVASGSQALAISDASGENLKPLTFDLDVGTQDMCPTLLPMHPDMVVFSRSLQGGFHNYVATLNLTSGAVVVHDDWPEIGDGSGCPAPLSPSEVMWLGCADAKGCNGETAPEAASARPFGGVDEALRWGAAAPPPSSAPSSAALHAQSRQPSGWAQLKAAPGGKPQVMFHIGLTKAPGYVNVFENSQCDRIWGPAPPANNSIICEGADPQHLFFLKHFVDPASGKAARNETTTLKHVMTPRPYALWHSAD